MFFAAPRLPGTRSLLSALLLFGLQSTPSLARQSDPSSADPLPRSAFLGAQVGPIDQASRDSQGLAPEVSGLLISRVVPGSTAESVGLAPGDILVSIDGKPITSAESFVSLVSGRREGDLLKLDYLRAGQKASIDARLKGRPRESSEDYEVVYGSVPAKNGLLRTIVTRPRGNGPFPALFIIQGLGCFSIENPSGPLSPYARIPDAFTRAGYLTLRVEKPGCGDSQGGPCGDVDFPTELDGYRQALKWLRNSPDVDPNRILLLGHSMGGVMGPILAAETPVLGLSVYGTVSKTWFEYVLANTRRQLRLAGLSDPDIDRFLRTEARFQSLFLYGGKSVSELAASDPELAQHIAQVTPDVHHLFGRNPEFFRQLNQQNMPEFWARIDAHVLAIHGEADFVSAAEDHEQIARIVNEVHPGRGRYLELPDSDHGFAQADTEADAHGRSGPGEMNPAILDVLLDWANGLKLENTGEAPATSDR